MDEKLVSVVIVNYNGIDIISDCLTSVHDQSYRTIETIVIDNASADGSVDWIKQNYPHIKLIENSKNAGFAAACNQGVRESQGEYVAFLNYDAVADEQWLGRLVVAAEEADDIGACMSKILLLDVEPPTINSSGGVVHYTGMSWAGDFNRPDGAVFNQKREVAFVSGAAALVKRTALDKVGLFDEGFFMYCEDTDLSWRMRLAGYRLMYTPASLVWHRYHFSKGKRKFYLLERNRLSMLLTNYDRRTLLLLLFPALIFEAGMMANALYGGWFFKKISAYGELFSRRKDLLHKRAVVQGLRKCPDSQITRLFVGKIDFDAVNGVFVTILNFFLALYWKAIFRFVR